MPPSLRNVQCEGNTKGQHFPLDTGAGREVILSPPSEPPPGRNWSILKRTTWTNTQYKGEEGSYPTELGLQTIFTQEKKKSVQGVVATGKPLGLCWRGELGWHAVGQ